MGLGGALALLAGARSLAIQRAWSCARGPPPFSIECGSQGTGLTGVRKEQAMNGSWTRIATRVLLGVILAFAAPTAWAAPPVDRETHFRCYIVSQQTPQAATTVTLSDQFLSKVALTVDEPLQFCAPVSKNGEPILEPEEHLTMYAAAAPLVNHLSIATEDQFGPRILEAVGARVLLVPTQKLEVEGVPTDLDFPTKLNHSWCYEVNGAPVDLEVTLRDQFRTDTVGVGQPTLFCNPVEKVVGGVTTRIEERDVHLTCYDIKGPQRTRATHVLIENQFEQDTFTITSFELLCVPSEKKSFSPI